MSETIRHSKPSRSSNLELYRIIAMLLVVAHHYVLNSGLTNPGGVIYSDPFSAKSLFLLFFGAFGKTGINCFMLITGYFMCTSHITLKKFVRVLCEVLFYHIIINCIFWITGYSAFSLKAMIKELFPVTELTQNFTGCYLVFFLCIPFLNILIRHMTERQHLRLLFLLFFAYVVMGTVPIFSVSMNYVSWFMVLYLTASYIRLYPKALFQNVRIAGWMSLISVLLSLLSVVFCLWLGLKMQRDMAYAFVFDANNFLAFLTGVASFLFFKNLKIKTRPFINTVATSTFGVLLIHANSGAMRRFLWVDLLKNVDAYISPLMPLHAIGSVIGIFVLCVLIDQCRIHLIEKPCMKLYDRVEPKLLVWYRRMEDKWCKRLHIAE